MTEETKFVRKTQRSSRLSTIISISLVLFLLGALGVLLLHARQLSDYVKENIEISLIIRPEADSLQTAALLAKITSLETVKSARVVSKEEAAEVLKKELGEDFVSFLGYNPLSPSIDIRLNAAYAEETAIAAFTGSMRLEPIVAEVQYQPNLVESINRNLRTITWITLSFSVLLILVSIALINNTIRISLYARRMLIRSMLLVGATKGFIRAPFLIKSMVNGMAGGMVANVLLAGVLYVATLKIPELSLIRDYESMGIVAGALLITGVILSLICTVFAVNKYLRYRTDNLY